MSEINILKELKNLKVNFDFQKDNNINNMSEETIRSGYINKLIELFGWNLSLTNEVIQEKVLSRNDRNKLKKIGSKHTRPDYMLLDRGVLRLYLDAKNIKDYTESKEVAFQIRSYGWTSQLNFSIVSNFEKFTIYDTSFKPEPEDDPNYKTIHFTIDDLINNYEKYAQFLLKSKVQKMDWELEEFEVDFTNSKSKSLDKDFLDLIGDFRLKLGQDLIDNNPTLNEIEIQYYTQIIINRLIFIRILEGRGLEPQNKLLSWLKTNKSFWDNFQYASLNDYYEKYDGALFCSNRAP